MNDKRALFNRLINSPEDTAPGQIRHVDVDETGQFLDSELKTPIGDPLRLDEPDLQHKVVLVNFFSLASQARIPTMHNLARVVNGMPGRVGKDVFINSVSIAPEQDSPLLLEKLALDLRAPRGWSFIRATENASRELVGRMNRIRGYTTPELVFYGIPGGYWGTFPAMNSPDELADRILGTVPTEKPATPRRAGPSIRGREHRPWTARELG